MELWVRAAGWLVVVIMTNDGKLGNSTDSGSEWQNWLMLYVVVSCGRL